MLSRAHATRLKAEKLIGLLTESKVKVTQRGTQAFVETNPSTLKPTRVNIPYLTDDAPESMITAIDGFLDHEVAHVLFTDWAVVAEAKNLGVASTHNIIEDIFIEHKMIEKFPGSKANLNGMSEAFIGVIDANFQRFRTTSTKKDLYRALAVVMFRALDGQAPYQDYMRDKWGFVDDVVARVGDYAREEFPKMKSSADALRVALEIKKLLTETEAEQPPQPSESEEQNEQQEKETGGSGDTPEEEGEGPSSEDNPEQDETDEDSHSNSDRDEDSESGAPTEGEPEESDEQEGDENENEGKSDDQDGQLQKEKRDKKSNKSQGDDDEGDDPSAGDSESDLDDSEGEERVGDFDLDSDTEPETEPETERRNSSDDDAEENDSESESNEEMGEASSKSDEDAVEDQDDNNSYGGQDTDEVQEGEFGSDPSESENGEDSGDGTDKDQDARAEKQERVSENNQMDGRGAGGGEPIDFEEFERNILDFDSSVAQTITKEAQKVAKESDYVIYTTDFDIVEKFDHKKKGVLPSNGVLDMENRVNGMISVIAKTLERAVTAQNRVAWSGGHRSGRLDSGALASLVRFNNDKVFRRKQEVMFKNTAVSLLIDCSGSMAMHNSFKIETAAQSAFALASALEKIRVKYEITGFTTGATIEEAKVETLKTRIGYARYESLYLPIFKGFEENMSYEVKERLASLTSSMKWMGGNCDGESLQIAGNRLLTRPEERKILIVLSDGIPATSGDEEQYIPHLRNVVTNLENVGVDVLGIGIKSDAVSAFYRKNIVVRSLDSLPTIVVEQLLQVLQK